MDSVPVILIFDIGKTNKKLLLFDSNFTIVYEKLIQISEVIDEDGFPCENIDALTQWII
ncbi:MAG: carbohydrate kinase, partial [Sediminibacterium sp.]|nr:carbohydrate kinase [Sediminibacterium sp.]